MSSLHIKLTGNDLTIEQVNQVAFATSVSVDICEKAKEQVNACRRLLEKAITEKEPLYGINTGFGANADKLLEDKKGDIKILQDNLILSHAVGVGPTLDIPLVRAIMLIRANTLLKGHSGIRLETVMLLTKMLENNIHPVIPELGSVGASGDLAPLSHMVMVMMGFGHVKQDNVVVNASEALEKVGLFPIKLEAKEGLALNNGTTFMTAHACISLHQLAELCDTADLAAAMTLEAMAGRIDAFDAKVHELRPHSGQQKSAENIRNLVQGSSLVGIGWNQIPNNSNRELFTIETDLHGNRKIKGAKSPAPQDAYCLRCTPQVHGAVRDAVSHATKIIGVELNSVSDNPIVDERNGKAKIISAGNFHGMPVALAMAAIKPAIATLASISERRQNKLVDPKNNDGLPGFLVQDQKGESSGFMIVQYVSAALVNELATMANPACVHSIPTCANTEDHVSMGANEARHVLNMTERLSEVIANEMYTAAQALDIRTKHLQGEYYNKADLDEWLNTINDEQERTLLKKHVKEVHNSNYAPAPSIKKVLLRIRDEIDFFQDDIDLHKGKPPSEAILMKQHIDKMKELVRNSELLRAWRAIPTITGEF